MMGDTRFKILVTVDRAGQTVPLILWAVLAPFLAYVSFVVYYLAIDLMRAIIAIPNAMSGSSRSGGSRAGKKTARKKRQSPPPAAAPRGAPDRPREQRG